MNFNKFRNAILVFLILATINIFGQIEYPRISIDSLGQKIVEMTLQQAQKLDNMTDMLILVKKLNFQLNQSDSICLKVVSESENVISVLKIQVDKLEETVSLRGNIIDKLKEEISLQESKNKILTEQVENRSQVIAEKDKQIDGLKRKLFWTKFTGIAVTTGALVLLLLIK